MEVRGSLFLRQRHHHRIGDDCETGPKITPQPFDHERVTPKLTRRKLLVGNMHQRHHDP
jgi:hypothetical protein